MGEAPREATDEEVREVLSHLPRSSEVPSPEEVQVSALCREDGAAWFWVYPIRVAVGDIYLTWVLERTPSGEWSVGSFRSRRTARGDVTVP
ncbi:MAG TPA: hypothetical protein ENK18_26235 [Deltaproteobacteria bacterium]|nr:hypothetical protein [Deltaproteobacteria bacterium]